MQTALIITAAGSSTRMGSGTKKEFLPLGDGTVLSQVCYQFLSYFSRTTNHNNLSTIVITCSEGMEEEARTAVFASPEVSRLLKQTGVSLVFTRGGDSRQKSVFNGLQAVAEQTDNVPQLVLIHDGARPWVSEAVIQDVCDTAAHFGSAVPAVPAVDTLALFTPDGTIARYLDRSQIMCLQTPQGFDFSKLYQAHKNAYADNRTDCTDDTTVWAAYYEPVHLCKGSSANRKITFADDISC